MKIIKPLIKRIFGMGSNDPSTEFAFRSYSQEGEDLILNRFFENKNAGFFVDIGAHHPFRFSNTYFFYRKGWRGINVDAMPGSMNAFKHHRYEDINIEAAVSDKVEVLTYYMFNEAALNTFSVEEMLLKSELKDYRLEGQIDIQTTTLSALLNENLPEEINIDFLTIDVEGLDFKVLVSNDWSRFKPKMILLEALRNPFDNLITSESSNFLSSKGYRIVAKTYNSTFFQLQ